MEAEHGLILLHTRVKAETYSGPEMAARPFRIAYGQARTGHIRPSPKAAAQKLLNPNL